MKEQKSSRQINSSEEEAEKREGTFWTPPQFALCANPLANPNNSKKGIWEDSGIFSSGIKTKGNPINNQNRDKIFGKTKYQPKDEKVEENKKLNLIGGSTKKEKEDGINKIKFEHEKNGNISASKKGLEAEGGGSISFSLIDFQKTLPVGPLPFNVLGEATSLSGFLQFSGMIGAEVKAELEAGVGKLQKTKNPLNISPQNLKAGMGGGLSAFAGAKLTIRAGGDYTWFKKTPDFYFQKMEKNYPFILSAIKRMNSGLGKLIETIDHKKFTMIVCQHLFSNPGAKNLVQAEAEGTGMAGVNMELKGGVNFSKGKLHMYGKAGIATGFGLGGEASLAFDLLEGILFGLAVGGELLSYVEPFLDKLFSLEWLYSLGAKVKEWINEKRQGKPSTKQPLPKAPYPMNGAKPAYNFA